MISAFPSPLWLLMIGRFPSSLFRLEAVPSRVRCDTDQLLCCLIIGIDPFGNFNSAIHIDIVRVKSYVNGFFNPPTDVPMWVSVNIFNLVPKRIMSQFVSMF